MAATYPVFVKHTFIGKAKQKQPYTARAHSRYIQRRSAAEVVRVHLMPENYQARQRWFYDHENGLRKNGRVSDNLTITIPYGIEPEHAAEALFRLGMRMGEARCPFELAAHTNDPKNYHAHVMFFDQDVETGKRVFRTTDRNSSLRIKMEWEAAANEAFAELGYDIRVKVRDGHAADNDNTLTAEMDEAMARDDAPLSTDSGLDTAGDSVESGAGANSLPESDAEDAGAGDSDLPLRNTLRHGVDESLPIPVQAVKNIHAASYNLHHLLHARESVAQAESRLASLIRQRNDASLRAGEYDVETLRVRQTAQLRLEALEKYQKEDGSLKGFGVQTPEFSVLGLKVPSFSIRSRTRRAAEAAQNAYDRIAPEANEIESTRSQYAANEESLTNEAEQVEATAEMKRNNLRSLYGDEAEIAAAESVMRDDLRKLVADVSYEDALAAYRAKSVTDAEFESYLDQAGLTEELANFRAEVRKVGLGEGQGYWGRSPAGAHRPYPRSGRACPATGPAGC